LRKGTSEVVKKKRTIRKFRKAFREEALERLRSCEMSQHELKNWECIGGCGTSGENECRLVKRGDQ
jgi:hypothetical protein